MSKIYEGRKVDEFIIYYVDGNGEPEGYEVYGVKQLKNALKWLHSDEVNAVSIDVYKRGKNFDNDSDDVIEYYSWEKSKKSARKSIKESKNSSILNDELYDLIDEGYIYDEDEDENGMNMSYGEYVAVSDDLWETLENELEHYRDFPSAYDAYNEIMDNTDDDAKMFMGVSDDDYFYFEMNEDENTYSFSGEVPTVLEKQFKKFLKETDFERV